MPALRHILTVVVLTLVVDAISLLLLVLIQPQELALIFGQGLALCLLPGAIQQVAELLLKRLVLGHVGVIKGLAELVVGDAVVVADVGGLYDFYVVLLVGLVGVLRVEGLLLLEGDEGGQFLADALLEGEQEGRAGGQRGRGVGVGEEIVGGVVGVLAFLAVLEVVED